MSVELRSSPLMKVSFPITVGVAVGDVDTVVSFFSVQVRAEGSGRSPVFHQTIPRGPPGFFLRDGAGDGIRTRDTKLGKLVLYQLSYARSWHSVAEYSIYSSARLALHSVPRGPHSRAVCRCALRAPLRLKALARGGGALRAPMGSRMPCTPSGLRSARFASDYSLEEMRL